MSTLSLPFSHLGVCAYSPFCEAHAKLAPLALLGGAKDLRGLIHFITKLAYLFECMRANLGLKGGG